LVAHLKILSVEVLEEQADRRRMIIEIASEPRFGADAQVIVTSSLRVLRRPLECKQYVSIKYTERLAEAGIGVSALDFGFSKYDANCRLNFHWNRGAIERLVNAMQTRMAA